MNICKRKIEPLVNIGIWNSKQSPLSNIQYSLKMLRLYAEVSRLSIRTLLIPDKRIIAKAIKEKYKSLKIVEICKAVGIAVSTYYYKPKRIYLPNLAYAKKPNPKQLSKLIEDLKEYTLDLIPNFCKRPCQSFSPKI